MLSGVGRRVRWIMRGDGWPEMAVGGSSAASYAYAYDTLVDYTEWRGGRSR